MKRIHNFKHWILFLLIIAPVRVWSGPDRFYLGTEVDGLEYKEPFMKQVGLLLGLRTEFQHDLESNFTALNELGLNLKLLTGRLNYDGETWGGRPLAASNQFTLYEVSSQGGWNIGSHLRPFVGLGLRGTFQNRESTNDYRREYYYLYSEFGSQFQFRLQKESVILISLQENMMVGGYNKSYLSEMPQHLPDVVVNFTSGLATQVAIKFQWRKNDAQIIRCGLNFLNWEVQQSQVANIGLGNQVFEPINQSQVLGLELDYLY